MTSTGKSHLAAMIKRCLDGDDQAWERLVDTITPVIFATCRSMRLSEGASLDVFGQVCYLLLTNLSRLKSAEKLISYTVTMTRREILAGFRRSKLMDEHRRREMAEGVIGDMDTPEDSVDKAQRTELLMKAIMRLPEKEAHLMWYLFLDEREPSYEEISKRLDIPVASIGPTRIRCLEKLRRIMKSMRFQF